MVDVAKYFMGFLKDESCGKCFTCRKGTQRMYEMLDDISKGKATLANTSTCSRSSPWWSRTRPCAVWGSRRPIPVLSTLRYFREEYEEHILREEVPGLRLQASWSGAPCASGLSRSVRKCGAMSLTDAPRASTRTLISTIREPNPLPSSLCPGSARIPCEAPLSERGGRQISSHCDPGPEALCHRSRGPGECSSPRRAERDSVQGPGVQGSRS